MLIVLLAAICAHETKADEGLELFENKIRPILSQHCYKCHSADAATKSNLKGNLFLDSRAGVRKGGDLGPAVVPGDVAASELLSALRFETVEMPPDGKLPDNVIADFEKWILMGAPDPRNQQANVEVEKPRAKKSWAFDPIKRPQIPVDLDDNWSRTKIDRFIFANLEDLGLQSVPDADRRTLLRRLYFDLIGLPPSAEQIDAFANSADVGSIAHVVDQLLASTHFGERWGRHWLDVVRYSDSSGGGANVVYDNAWRYRDYVIRSFNSDKPFDQFAKEQIAGDLLASTDNAAGRERLVATGFLALGPKELAEYDLEQLQWDTVDEQIDTLGKSFMGLTLGCARCHDHKFDAISTGDYYALAGIFRSTQTLLPKRSGVIVQWTKLSLPGAEKQKAIGVAEVAGPGDCNICVRGNKDQLGPTVARGFPKSILPSVKMAADTKQSGRLQLADWLTDPAHPLTARVFVNRVWQHLLGAGLVRTPDNFGTRGQRPTHPKLLDHLASEFIADGWSIKRLVRKIVLSRVYGLSSKPHSSTGLHKQAMEIDPENRLIWRQNRQRLDAEAIRDAMLLVSGRLQRTPFGNTMTYTGRIDTPKSDKKTKNPRPWQRRSVYLPRYRGAYEHDLLKTFDAPHPALVTGQRIVTNVPNQALYLMNSPFVMEQAQSVAMQTESIQKAGDRVNQIYRKVLGRNATAQEIQQDIALVRECNAAFAVERHQLSGQSHESLAGWSSLCQTLLASNEFLFLD